MSDIAKYVLFPRRQKSADSGFSDDADGNHMRLQRLKSIDENDNKDLERSATLFRTRPDSMQVDHANPSNQIKTAAIYDEEAEILEILSSAKENKKGWLQSPLLL